MFKIALLTIIITLVYGALLGTWKTVSNNNISLIVNKTAEWAMKEINKNLVQNNIDGYHTEIVAITDLSKQSVTGTNYKYTMHTIYKEFDQYIVRIYFSNKYLKFNSIFFNPVK